MQRYLPVHRASPRAKGKKKSAEGELEIRLRAIASIYTSFLEGVRHHDADPSRRVHSEIVVDIERVFDEPLKGHVLSIISRVRGGRHVGSRERASNDRINSFRF